MITLQKIFRAFRKLSTLFVRDGFRKRRTKYVSVHQRKLNQKEIQAKLRTSKALSYLFMRLHGRDERLFRRLVTLAAIGAIALSYHELLAIGGGLLLGIGTSVIPPGYVMTAEARRRVENWRTTAPIADRAANLHYLAVTLREELSYWSVDETVCSAVEQYDSIVDGLIKKISGPTGTSLDRQHLQDLISKARNYVFDNVEPWAVLQCNKNVIAISDLNMMGFLLREQRGGHHDRLPIPTEIPTVKFSQKGEPDKGFVIIERDANKDSEQGSGGAWPDGVNGATIGIKLVSEPESAYRYQYVTTIHTCIDIPTEWRGQKMHIKAAYCAHPTDPIDQLHWSQPQTILLLNAVDEA